MKTSAAHTQQSRQPMSKTDGFAPLLPNNAERAGHSIIGAVGLEEKAL
jgi:hypothetical protein